MLESHIIKIVATYIQQYVRNVLSYWKPLIFHALHKTQKEKSKESPVKIGKASTLQIEEYH